MQRPARGYANRSAERGSALFEYALALALLFTFMFGIMDFSRALYAYHWASYAAHDATRWASLRGSSCRTFGSACPAAAVDVTNYVKGIVSGGITVAACNAQNNNPGCLVVTTTWPGATGNPTGCDTSRGTNSPGCPVNVQVQYRYGFTLPFVSRVASISMLSTSRLTISQ